MRIWEQDLSDARLPLAKQPPVPSTACSDRGRNSTPLLDELVRFTLEAL
ncbi:hypothetical protein L5849_05015 [Erythrobacter sp. SN021]|nr:hypothetical protein [Erythrobacter sp. SN021]MCF8882058.1 hypothetical protein [Erythrobacter sp. SN021]